jgi:hypothetical protein
LLFYLDTVWSASFVEPKIEGNSKCRFQAKTENKNIFYGVCQLNGIKYSDDNIYDSIKNGVFFYCQSPSRNTPNNDIGNNRIRDEITIMDVNDIMEVEYIQ